MRFSLPHRLIALLLLMAYTITGTSVLPAMVAVLAVVDGGHEVLVGQTEGGVRLTLHHRPGEYTPCVADHHNALARVLVSLCRSSQQGDHQIASTRFESTTDGGKKSLARAVKRPAPVNTVATLLLGQILTATARATSRQGMVTTMPVLHGPACRPVLSTVQMLM